MSSRQLYAHSRSPVSGARHELTDHLRESAVLARRFGDVFGAGELAEYLALVHDVGKGCCAWQDGLLQRAEPEGKPVGIPHKEAGARLAAKYAGLPFAAVVQGHHGGLPDQQKIKDVLTALQGSGPDAEAAREATRRVAGLVPEIVRTGPVVLPPWVSALRGAAARTEVDLLVRMVFSCLVDADFLDTSAHFDGRVAPRLAPARDMALLSQRFEERRAAFLAKRPASPVDEIRGRVFAEAVAAAAREPGMYVLHAPTGGAKTIAAGGFALRHAARHGMRRVVFAVPFISITQQNAAVYRSLLDPLEEDADSEPVVLEHHSSVSLDEDSDEGTWARLAAENWDAPVVVTTMVQLFQSLFSAKPSAMRKLHRLAGAVIVLDEVQALPDRLLNPILSVLRGLVERYGATVVLASATQPDFWSLSKLDGVPRHGMVEDVPGLFDELRRVTYEWQLGDDVTWQSVAEDIEERADCQVLAVVNTTRDSAHLHRLLTECPSAPGPVLHLSTRMTAEHRREVIERIRTHLKEHLPVRLVSTSLIEAGVDVDFPSVYRAWAPAESLQQAAGRCNRDSRMHEPGTVVVFRPADGGTPKDLSYLAALEATAEFFGPYPLADPDDLKALAGYYAKRYALQGEDHAMGERIEELRRAWDFPQVAREFRMIDDVYGQSVVVVRSQKTAEEQDAIWADIHRLRAPYPSGPECLRRLQPHTATLPRHEVAEALRTGLAEPVVGDLVVWRGHYDEVRGLDPEDREDSSAFLV
ncbi:CRISPR-associated endonuclease Cas3'' [Streptomyces griseolus]|nr:CRISPR-associated endonuclease Cas3'' [Streptomyces griseolus]MCW8219874.1 CRISPR-associated endonuclease Cas3'' [Streptomyces griseolus]